MKRWVRRSLLAVALVLALIALLSGVGVGMFRSRPSWYVPRDKAQAAQQKQWAQQAENKLIDAQNWAAELRADAVRSARAAETGAARPATRAHDSYIVEFTQDELNALFDKWSVLYGWSSKYGSYVSDPAIVLHDGKLILAGNVAALGTVVSVQFQPQVEPDGKFRIPMVSVTGGRLPLPDAAWRKYRVATEVSIRREMPRWKQQAKISPSGSANNAAVCATMGRLFFKAMNRQDADGILFLPVAGGGDSVPVRVTNIEIEEGKLAMSVVPLTAQERAQLLDKIRTGVE